MNFCPLHPDQKMFEKTGEFGPYYSHIIQDVGFCNGKRIKPFAPKPTVPSTYEKSDIEAGAAINAVETREPVKEDKPDWDEIAKGKVRHGVSIAIIEKEGGYPTAEIKLLINEWVEFIMTGK